MFMFPPDVACIMEIG